MLKSLIRYEFAGIKELSKKDYMAKIINVFLFGYLLYFNEKQIDFVIYTFSLLFTILSFSLKKGMYLIPVDYEYRKRFVLLNYVYKFLLFILIQAIIFLIELLILKNDVVTIFGMTFCILNFYLLINSPDTSIRENIYNTARGAATFALGLFLCIINFTVWATDISEVILVDKIKLYIIISLNLCMFGMTILNVREKLNAIKNIPEYL